ncbi:GntR family transcriptional regulator [Acidisarcina polymorpha]|uniref:GntR family transcriptional regulator n=1 Tax=Acidisarcina polymorpha TaxID=2211140 RepID=UPI001374E240|nr:winged helix-turn-helix domain-containing protein [Acidisarcina polymorpha]
MRRFLVVPEIALDRSATASLRQQIHTQIAAAVRRGTLPDGALLPSSRLLAKLLKVSRNTVVDAYEKLLEDGLITTRAGSGIKVNRACYGFVPNFWQLRRTAGGAHYPIRTISSRILTERPSI